LFPIKIKFSLSMYKNPQISLLFFNFFTYKLLIFEKISFIIPLA
jgi:hypothetical protein